MRAHPLRGMKCILGLLTEAIREYVGRRRVRPHVLRHLEDSMRAHEDLGRRLAR